MALRHFFDDKKLTGDEMDLSSAERGIFGYSEYNENGWKRHSLAYKKIFRY